eukprot:217640-Amphidinium_carterae.1
MFVSGVGKPQPWASLRPADQALPLQDQQLSQHSRPLNCNAPNRSLRTMFKSMTSRPEERTMPPQCHHSEVCVPRQEDVLLQLLLHFSVDQSVVRPIQPQQCR